MMISHVERIDKDKNWLPLQEDYKSWCFGCEPLAISFAGTSDAQTSTTINVICVNLFVVILIWHQNFLFHSSHWHNTTASLEAKCFVVVETLGSN